MTGKSTLIRKLLPARRLEIDLSDPSLRSRYLVEPERLIQECQKLPKQRGGFYVFVDEAQSVPAIFDAVQHLYDGDKQRWRFVICGSSARKLRTPGANLLPGRSFLHRKLTPVEVKWTQNPSLSDARHLLGFLREHPKTAQHGYLICRCPLPRQLHDKVTALPWFCL